MVRVKKVPSYGLHKQSGQARVVLTDSSGRRRHILLGPYGSPESHAEYARVIAEWDANAHTLATRIHEGNDITINELILRFWAHVEEHYRHADGTQTSEVENYRFSLRPVRELYGHTLVADFGPLALKAVRQKMIDAKLARSLINQRIGRVKRMFKWAVSEEFASPSIFHGLQSVTGLQRGRSKAKERDPVLPVTVEAVEAVLPFLNRYARGIVQLQRLTGMRPTEACRFRMCDVDTTGANWLYRPPVHKTAWRGKQRVIHIGPQAQAMLKEYITEKPDEFLFSPRRAMEEIRGAQRSKRKSKVQPSQQNRKKRKPKKQPGERYTRHSLVQAIRNACKKAGIPHWHPNQLRHSFATEVRKRYGLEGAQVGLGHSRADVTQVYAERDASLASRIASEIG